MSISVGSVSVDSSGNGTGSGMALAIWNAMVSNMAGSLPSTAPAAAIISWKQGMAPLATAIASGVVTHLQSNVAIGAGTFKDSVNNNPTTGAGTFS